MTDSVTDHKACIALLSRGRSQNKGKESENSYQNLMRSLGQAHENTWKLYRNISTGMAVFINQKRVNVCEHMTQMASLESL